MEKLDLIHGKKRITRRALHLKIAELISLRGTCGRLQVGAVATIENRIVATGYNGPAPNEPHCSAEHCDLTKPCTRAVHAEQNLIMWAIEQNVDLKNTTLYVTHQPCIDCAKAIRLVGIKKVYFTNEYRLTEGLDYLKTHGIEVRRFTPTGS